MAATDVDHTASAIGLIAPGAMGASVGAAVDPAHVVRWSSAGRSDQTCARALEAGLVDAGSFDQLVSTSEILISVCPPGDAEAVARRSATAGFDGIYVEANAVAPSTVRRIAAQLNAARVVDGAIVGPPAAVPGTTRLYLSGKDAGTIAELFVEGPLEPIVLGPDLGAASALKVAYGAYTKGVAALLLNTYALARAEGVDTALVEEWRRSLPHLEDGLQTAVAQNVHRAWRVVAEMQQGAEAFEGVGLPGGFSRAAAEAFARLDTFKDVSTAVELDHIVTALLARPGG